MSDTVQADFTAAELWVAAIMTDGTYPKYNTGCQYGMYKTPAGLQTAVARCLDALRPIADTFDILYVTGQSGVIPASIVAYLLNKQLLILRKQDAHGDTHSHGALLEGTDVGRAIILDDFISRGGTLLKLLKWKPTSVNVVGICLYGHPCGTWPECNENYVFRHCVWDDDTPVYPWKVIRRTPHSAVMDIVVTEGHTNPCLVSEGKSE